MAINAGTSGTEISVRDCMVLQAKKKTASGMPSHVGDLRLAGISIANLAAFKSPSLPSWAFCSKGLC